MNEVRKFKVGRIELDDVVSPMSNTDRCLLLPKCAETISEDLYVVSDMKEGSDWLEFCFLEFQSAYSESEVFCRRILSGCGPLGGLNECRHTYWGDHDQDGYLFYPNKTNIIAALNWLEGKGFELS